MGRHSRQLLVRALLLEGALCGIAVIWAFLQDIPWRPALTPTLADCVTGISAGLLLLIINYVAIEYGSRYSSFLRTIRRLIEEDVSQIFKHVNLVAVVLIAIVSGVAEELFFRGVLQAQIGIWLTSVIFGLAHIWKKTAVLYGIYATIIGLLFGGMYMWSGSLWVPMLAHVVNNFVAILYYMHYIIKPESPIVPENIL
jgi:membrane protease YdiL (CAAX protease family)